MGRKQVPSPPGLKYCAKCDQHKPKDCFTPDARASTGLSCWCKECFKEQRRDYYDKVGNRMAFDTHLRSTYGVSADEYDALLELQGGGCAICGAPQNPKRRHAVDHCHATGKNRAILCIGCNSGLAGFRDNTDVLQKAIAYLEKLRDIEDGFAHVRKPEEEDVYTPMTGTDFVPGARFLMPSLYHPGEMLDCTVLEIGTKNGWVRFSYWDGSRRVRSHQSADYLITRKARLPPPTPNEFYSGINTA